MSIVRYRKRPVVVDTIHYNGTNAQELVAWGVTVQLTVTDDIVIATLESSPAAQVRHVAQPGDFIIKGVQGEFYPCKASIFKETYELVPSDRPRQ